MLNSVSATKHYVGMPTAATMEIGCAAAGAARLFPREARQDRRRDPQLQQPRAEAIPAVRIGAQPRAQQAQDEHAGRRGRLRRHVALAEGRRGGGNRNSIARASAPLTTSI